MCFQLIKSKFIKAALFAAFFCLLFSVQAHAKLPEHIAVLPIEGDGKPEDLKELRITFFNHIGFKNYRDMELGDIDSKLYLLEQQTGKKWREFPQKELADNLGVDGLIYLNVVGIDKIYAGFYGSLTVTLEVTFVEAETGRIIWKKEDQVVRQSGGVPLSPWAAISTAVQSALVLRDSVKIELFDKLCRNLAKELPEPPSLTADRAPTIFSVQTNTLDSPFKAQDEILVSLKGDEKMKAYFNIVGQTDAVQLNEMQPGLYLGKIVVTEGTNYKSGLMEVFLVNTEKRLVSKYQVPYLVTVDTTPPGEPLKFDASYSEAGFKLTWDKPADDDIKEYVIMKAVVGQAEYEDLAVTQINEYVDDKVTYGQKVFYRLFARDLADNMSKPSEISRIVVKPGPTDVTGELKENTIFYSYGSPYIVKGALTVPKGMKLTIEAGSVVRFEDGASLAVLGGIDSEGTAENGVTFKGKDYNITMSDTGTGGGIFRNSFFRNGGVFEISNSDATFMNCRFESFAVAMKITQGSAVKINGGSFGYNQSALVAEAGTLDMDGTEFAHNAEAISVMTDFKANIGSLMMKQNTLDITATTDLAVNRAEVPEKESYEIIRSFRGPVDIARVEPFGKSLKEIKYNSGNDLTDEIGESLIEDNFEETVKYMALMKELFPERYAQLKAVDGYALFKTGDQKDAKTLITSSDASYKDKLAASLGLSEHTGPAVKVRFVKVKIPVFGNGEGIGKIAVSKAVKQSVKDHVEGITGRLERKKSFIVKDKILTDTDKYSTGAYPVATRVDGSIFEGLYLVFLDTNLILAELQDLRIIGNKKREMRIGLASCGDGDNVRPELAKELNNLLFPLTELPSKGCGYSGYKDDLTAGKIDLLVIVKEAATASKSRVSQNLQMINADMDIMIFDAKSGMQLHDESKGVVVYHMNESMGKKAAMQQAFKEAGSTVLDKLVEIERERAPKPKELENFPAAKADTQKKQPAAKAPVKQAAAPAAKPADNGKGIILSVAGVEPVFANTPDAFVNRPFMTLVIENESNESIRSSELVLDVPGYFPSPVSADLESIPALDRVRLQLFAEFTEDLKKTTKTKRTDSVISIKYGAKKTEIKYPVVIFDSHTVRWDTGDKLALFTDSGDPAVKAAADGISASLDKLTADPQHKKLYAGLAAFDYMTGIGLTYRPDDKRPFAEVYGSNTKVDSAMYPSELLAAKGGDADDLLIFYGAVLNAMGVDMGFTVNGGKVTALFDTTIPEELLDKFGFAKDKVVIYDENIWLPIDITMVASGAEKAWAEGSAAAAAFGDGTKINVLSKALGKYKPLELFRQKVNAVPASSFDAKYETIKNLFK